MGRDPDDHEGDEPPVQVPLEDVLDLHSFLPRDQAAVAEEYLAAAVRAGFTTVRLIHGRGIGVQRRRVQALLAAHPLVLRFADAPEEAGGRGATLVWLRPAT